MASHSSPARETQRKEILAKLEGGLGSQQVNFPAMDPNVPGHPAILNSFSSLIAAHSALVASSPRDISGTDRT
jgi:hypothetical protein